MSLLGNLSPQTWVAEKALKYGPSLLKGLGKLLLGVALLTGAYFYGKQAQRLEYEQQKAAEAAKEVETIKDEAAERTQTAEDAGARQERLLRNIERGQENLNEAINQGGDKPACDLNDDELRAFNEIGS